MSTMIPYVVGMRGHPSSHGIAIMNSSESVHANVLRLNQEAVLFIQTKVNIV